MKKRIRLGSAFLVLIMFSALFGGCGSSESAAPAAGTTAEITQEQAPAVETASGIAPEAPAESVPSEEAAPPEVVEAPEEWKYGMVSLPIVEKSISLSYWISANTSVMGLVSDYSVLPGYEYLEEMTGIELTFKYYDRNDKATQLSLMVASGDLTDFLPGIGNTYNGGLDKALDDNVIIDLTPYADTLMKNYQYVCSNVEEYELNMKTDSGYVLEFGCFQSTDRPVVMGPTVRKDWLDRIGMDPEDIVTYDDYYEMLTKFRDEIGADSALLIGASGVPDHNYLASGYNVTVYAETDEGGTGSAMPFLQIDGMVKYSPLESGYLDYLTMIRQWYSEGLIYTDFMSQTFPVTMFDLVASNRTGLFYPYSVMFEMIESMNDDPDFELVGIMDAVSTPGSENHLRRSTDLYEGDGVAIAATCAYIEEAIQYCDFMYTEEGNLIYNYGVEGVSYTITDGIPTYTEVVTTNPDNLSSEDAIVYYTAGVCGVQSNSNRMQMWADHVVDAVNTWGTFDNAYAIPYGVSMTADEATEFNGIYADIATYVSENTLQFIIGEKSLNEYDSFVAQIESAGINRCLEIYQEALNRYYDR